MQTKNRIIVFILLLITLTINAMDNTSDSYKQLAKGYKKILLGMSQEDVKSILENTPEFNIKHEETLTIRMQPDTEIISAEGYGFIREAYFHFDNDRLFQIFMKLDEQRIGYYLLLKRLTKKYGPPQKFTPKDATWEDLSVIIKIEKPCTIRYLKKDIWSELIQNDLSSDKIIENVREKFIDNL